MAPSAEPTNGNETGMSYEVIDENPYLPPKRNVTFAVNYELSMVDQFMAGQRQPRRSTIGGGVVETVPDPTTPEKPPRPNLASSTMNHPRSSSPKENTIPNVPTTTAATTTTSS